MMHFDCLTEKTAHLLANRLTAMGRSCTVHEDQASSDLVAPHIAQLEGWIVLVVDEPKDDWDTYNVIADIAEEYGAEGSATYHHSNTTKQE